MKATHVDGGDQSEPWGLALAGVPLMALKMPIESDRALLEPSSTGLICKTRSVRKVSMVGTIGK